MAKPTGERVGSDDDLMTVTCFMRYLRKEKPPGAWMRGAAKILLCRIGDTGADGGTLTRGFNCLRFAHYQAGYGRIDRLARAWARRRASELSAR